MYISVLQTHKWSTLRALERFAPLILAWVTHCLVASVAKGVDLFTLLESSILKRMNILYYFSTDAAPQFL